jgi:uncharacterized membrane protein YphA (DoxX/SURF4 family)
MEVSDGRGDRAPTREVTMTVTTTAAQAVTSSPSRTRRVLTWAPRAGLAVAFASGGLMKLIGEATMTAMFAELGAGQWLRVVVGALELAAAIGLLVPRLARAAAAGLVALMAGAVVTNVAVLGTSPVVPLFYLLLATAVAIPRRTR